jgi:hypothetical protein
VAPRARTRGAARGAAVGARAAQSDDDIRHSIRNGGATRQRSIPLSGSPRRRITRGSSAKAPAIFSKLSGSFAKRRASRARRSWLCGVPPSRASSCHHDFDEAKKASPRVRSCAVLGAFDHEKRRVSRSLSDSRRAWGRDGGAG